MKRALTLLLLLPSLLTADEVFFKGGGRLQGVVVEQDAKTVVVEMGPGRVTVPRSRVQRIVSGSVALTTYRERASRLAATDTAGWLELALWARERDLTTQAQEAFERVVTLDPANAVAQRALGRESVGGHWLSRDEAMRARGLVEFEGRWVSREEREAALEERATEQAANSEAELAERRQAEAEARIREAEARAREAEARARAAEAEAEATKSGGIPLPLVGWGGGVVQPCCGRIHVPGVCPYGGRVFHPRPHPTPTSTPSPTPTPKPPPRDGGQASTREIKPKPYQPNPEH
jgi:hypothetical protein